MSAPAQVTEAHIALSARITRENGYDPESTWNRPHVVRDAQYIADSEAKACDQLRAEVRAVLEIVNEQTARAELAERELERLREQQIDDAKSANESISFLKARAERAEAKLK